MSLMHIHYYSSELSKLTNFYITAPDDANAMMKQGNPHYDRPMRLLVLLHGYTGDAADWITGSPIRELAGKYNLAVVMPSGDNSFYVDAAHTGGKYASFVGRELVAYVRGLLRLPEDRESTFIGGYSMGGYGAIHVGLCFPETFSRVIGLSNALIIEELDKMDEGNPVANRAYYELCFGNLAAAAQKDVNPKVQINKLLEAGGKLPEFYLACGTEDFLHPLNLAFAAYLKEKGVKHVYHEGPGQHDWTFWNSCLVPALEWLEEGEL